MSVTSDPFPQKRGSLGGRILSILVCHERTLSVPRVCVCRCCRTATARAVSLVFPDRVDRFSRSSVALSPLPYSPCQPLDLPPRRRRISSLLPPERAHTRVATLFSLLGKSTPPSSPHIWSPPLLRCFQKQRSISGGKMRMKPGLIRGQRAGAGRSLQWASLVTSTLTPASSR